MVQYNEYFGFAGNVERLGYSNTTESRIPLEYLEDKQFILFRTCHSYGDWVILSAMPRLLKQKYPDCTVVIPSPECIRKFFNPNQWMNKHENPFNNVIEIFKNNPWVDGMVDEIPQGMPVYHDHFRIYDESNPNIPLIQQMLKFWRFEDNEMQDCQPELYWDSKEQQIGDALIQATFENKEFGFLYIDDSFFYSEPWYHDKIESKRELIQQEIHKHNIEWLYFSGPDNFLYETANRVVDVKNLKTTLRIQNYIKSKAKLIIGHQGGYGTDCMPRYTPCYVVPLVYDLINEHIQFGTKYLK